jgi:hypothetical protein
MGLAPDEYFEGVRDFRNPNPTHEFQWSIGEILTSLLSAGLRIEVFREYPYSNGCKLFDVAVLDERGRVHLPADMPPLPQMFSLSARKV